MREFNAYCRLLSWEKASEGTTVANGRRFRGGYLSERQTTNVNNKNTYKQGEFKMIALACDHGGLEIKNAIIESLKAKGVEYIDLGTNTTDSVDYPIYAKALCKEITEGRCEKGILCCGTGIGMSIAANKVRGIRAAVLSDEFSAEMTRRHNNTNVLCLGGRVIDCEKAVKLADIFLNTEYEGGRHDKRVAMLED